MNLAAFERILNRYIKGKATAEEKAFIEHWLAIREADMQRNDNKEHRDLKHSIWEAVSRQTGISKSHTPLRYLKKAMKYAAALLLLALCTIWLYHALQPAAGRSLPAIIAAKGQPRLITLPDSTVVRLFPGSALSISEHYNNTNRTVNLQGRAFFDVKEQASRPFIVNAGSFQATVLGTSFELSESDSLRSVTVLTGKVQVKYAGLPLGIASPDIRIRYHSLSRQLSTDTVQAAQLCEWWKQGPVFKQTAVSEIAHSLGNWYNRTIQFRNPKVLHESLTIRFTGSNLEEDIALLAATIQASYQITEQTIIIQ